MALARLFWCALVLGALGLRRPELPGFGYGGGGASKLEAWPVPHVEAGGAEDGESLLAVSAEARSRGILPVRQLAVVGAGFRVSPGAGHLDMAGFGDRDDVDGSKGFTWLQEWLDSFGRLKPPAELLGLTEDPALTEVISKTPTGVRTWLKLPKTWAKYLASGGAQAIGTTWERGVCKATFVWASGRRVAFRSAAAAAIATQRTLRIMERLRSCGEGDCGHIVKYFDMCTFDDRTFMLLEAADETIEDFVSRQSGDGRWDGGQVVPLNRSIPILVDLLRGLGALESIGILHGGVSARSVGLVDGRVIIDGLAAACLAERAQDEEVWMQCTTMTDSWPNEFLTSPVWQLGDIFDGSPNESKDMSWSAGVLLAYMCFGVNPVDQHVSQFHAELALGAQSRPGARRTIRREVRDNFRIHDTQGFLSLDADVQRLLSGLLAADPKERLDISAALREVEALAARRGIEVPPPRMAPEAPKIV